MKTDRFVKVMLVIIAGLLLLNCIDKGSVISPPIKANAPAFLETNKTYECANPGGLSVSYKITKIDKDSGWIEDNGTRWVNTAIFFYCEEVKTQ